MSIIRRHDKITQKEAEALGSEATSIVNLLRHDKKLADVYQHILDDYESRWFSSKVVIDLGEPLVKMRKYESSPGLWIFDDTETNITFLIWSDGYKKKPWKGTSYEVIASDDKLNNVGLSFERLIDNLKLLRSDIENEDNFPMR